VEERTERGGKYFERLRKLNVYFKTFLALSCLTAVPKKKKKKKKTCARFSIIYDHVLTEDSIEIIRGTNEIHVQARRTRAVNFEPCNCSSSLSSFSLALFY
jgi:hypothetical protein